MVISCLKNKTAPGFECTGSDESKVWNHLEKEVPKMFNCQGVCRDHYELKIVPGLHSFVSLGLGKDLSKKTKWKNAFWDLKKEFDDVATFCSSEGNC